MNHPQHVTPVQATQRLEQEAFVPEEEADDEVRLPFLSHQCDTSPAPLHLMLHTGNFIAALLLNALNT